MFQYTEFSHILFNSEACIVDNVLQCDMNYMSHCITCLIAILMMENGKSEKVRLSRLC